MKPLNLRLGQSKLDINPKRLENLFAQGLSQKEIAIELGCNYCTLSRLIANSFSLDEARRKGLKSVESD